VIYLSRPHINRRQIRAVTRVLKSGQLVQGPEVEAFEAEVGSLIGVTHCVAVNSGTSALHLGMLGLVTKSLLRLLALPQQQMPSS
jgi:perosamine synthetase